MVATALVAVLAVFVIFVSYYLKATLWPEQSENVARGSSTTKKIPGMSKSDPENGNLPDIATAGSLHEFLMLLHSKYGHVASFWYGKHYYVSLASPEAWKDHIKIFDRPPELFEFLKPLLRPECIQYVNGKTWKQTRKAYDVSFSYEAIKNYFTGFQQAADSLVEKFMRVPVQEHIPMSEHMAILTVKAISLTLYGDLFKDDEQAVTLLHQYETVMESLNKRLTDDVESEESFNNALKGWHDVMRVVLQHRRDNRPDGEDPIFLDVLMDFCKTEEHLLADAVTFFVASFHTTGYLMVWTLYYLCKHQDVQDKVYSEVMEVLGRDGHVTHENQAKLKYMRNVFDETMRCVVLAPFAARVNYEHDMDVQGYTIPKGTAVIHALGVVQQDKKIWPNPERFDPNRFLPEEVAKRHPLTFSPFGLGKRICPGYRLSYAEATVFLATLVKTFKFSLVEGQDFHRKYGLVTIPSEEIWMTVTKRE